MAKEDNLAISEQEFLVNQVSKWKLPGWKPEAKYSPMVMVGNWYDERRKYLPNPDVPRPSTHQHDYLRYSKELIPDRQLMRMIRLRDEGAGRKILLDHNGGYCDDIISMYDEHFNRKSRPDDQKLPKLRTWHGHSRQWVPHVNDYPLTGTSTNFDLFRRRKEQWTPEFRHDTTYRKSYNQDPRVLSSHMTKHRAATPKCLSSSTDPSNLATKSYKPRGVSLARLPEFLNPTVKCKALPPIGEIK